MDRNGLSVSTETACRFPPKSPVGNSEICTQLSGSPILAFRLPRRGPRAPPRPERQNGHGRAKGGSISEHPCQTGGGRAGGGTKGRGRGHVKPVAPRPQVSPTLRYKASNKPARRSLRRSREPSGRRGVRPWLRLRSMEGPDGVEVRRGRAGHSVQRKNRLQMN